MELREKTTMMFVLFWIFLFLTGIVVVIKSGKLSINNDRVPHEMVIVLATDNGFVEPTAVLLQSVKLTTPQSKTFIILGDEVTPGNRAKLEQMQDENNKIVWVDLQEEKYQHFFKQVEDYKTSWHRLVALRLVYAELLQDIKIQGHSIERFIHLDSDMYALKDISDLWHMEFEQDKLFIAANYSCVLPKHADFFPNIRYVQPHICGGVVVWNVKAILAKFKQAGKNIFLYDAFKHNQQALLCTNDLTYVLVHKLVKFLENEKNLPKDFIYAPPEIQKRVFRFIDSTPELKELIKLFPETFNDIVLNRAFGFFVYYNAVDPESEYRKQNGKWKFDTSQSYATEEIIFNPYSQLIDFSYDFLTKFTMPDLLPDETLRKNCQCILSLILQYREIQQTLKKSIDNMKILHFCSKPKPWDDNIDELIANDPECNYCYQVYRTILNTTPFYKTATKEEISRHEYEIISDKVIKSIRERIHKHNPILHSPSETKSLLDL